VDGLRHDYSDESAERARDENKEDEKRQRCGQRSPAADDPFHPAIKWTA
jgi:hypothetical protein